MRFERVWVVQCRATKAIGRRFGAKKSALDYLIGEKLMTFADAARDHPTFAKELPRFLAAIWQMFDEYEISGHIASRKPGPESAFEQARRGLVRIGACRLAGLDPHALQLADKIAETAAPVVAIKRSICLVNARACLVIELTYSRAPASGTAPRSGTESAR